MDTLKEILKKLEPIDPRKDKFFVSYELVDTLYTEALKEKNPARRKDLWNVTHLISLLSDIELLNKTKTDLSDMSIDFKIETYKEIFKKIFHYELDKKAEREQQKQEAKEDIPDLKKVDLSKCEIKQDTFF